MLNFSKILAIISCISPLIGAIITCAGNLWINRTKSKKEISEPPSPSPGITNIYNVNITINGLHENPKSDIDYKMIRKNLKGRNKRTNKKI
jgi:hypothetical protein